MTAQRSTRRKASIIRSMRLPPGLTEAALLCEAVQPRRQGVGTDAQKAKYQRYNAKRKYKTELERESAKRRNAAPKGWKDSYPRKEWTRDETDILVALAGMGYTQGQMAFALEKSKRAIRHQLQRARRMGHEGATEGGELG